MGEIIPFKKRKKKVHKNLTVEMVYNDFGFGVNPHLLKAVQITKNNSVYFVFDSPKDVGLDIDTPSSGIRCDYIEEAVETVRNLVELMNTAYNKDIKVFYDKS